MLASPGIFNLEFGFYLAGSKPENVQPGSLDSGSLNEKGWRGRANAGAETHADS
jgi:hypothetical protein